MGATTLAAAERQMALVMAQATSSVGLSRYAQQIAALAVWRSRTIPERCCCVRTGVGEAIFRIVMR